MTRWQNVFRGSATDQDMDLGAEPLTKKRVAFKDDVVDGVEMGNYRSGRSQSVPPQLPPVDDLSAATPTDTAPRPNRSGPRGRPGSVGAAGKRPLLR